MRKILTPAMALCLAGCASVLSESTYAVDINTEPPGARITVTDDEGGTFFEAMTPTTVTLSAKKGFFRGRNYTIQASLPGYETVSVPIARTLDGWYFANILLGGVIGMLIVDPATGAMWKLEEDVVITLDEAPAPSEGSFSVQVLSLDQLPRHLRSELVPVIRP